MEEPTNVAELAFEKARRTTMDLLTWVRDQILGAQLAVGFEEAVMGRDWVLYLQSCEECNWKSLHFEKVYLQCVEVEFGKVTVYGSRLTKVLKALTQVQEVAQSDLREGEQ